MIEAVIIMGGLGILIGTLLAAASKVFYVYVDPKVLAVEDALPGANCGGCGFPGCSSNAEAIVAGKSPPTSCVAAGADVAEAVAAILGISVEAKEPDIALPGCTYGVAEAKTKFLYNGINDCRAAALISGGMKVCTIGCLGLGTCARACPFDAITMGPDGIPAVDNEKCTGCGTCERVCPKHIIKLSSVTRRILLEYTVDDCTTPCQRACPAGIDIREYIRQITLGNYERSVQVIKERNPFPSVIGRICPRPCELECRRKLVDEPVAINYLKRFVADYERQTGKRSQPYKAPSTGRKIAVIGGGVQGLSTAFFSARLGHDATVYEASSEMGGLLRTAIARERLPREVLDWDIEGIREIGVALKPGQTMGTDFTAASLLENGYDAVFLASGGWDSRLARGAVHVGEQAVPGAYLLLDVMKSGSENKYGLSVSGDAVIVGGGELAVEAAGILKSIGAGKVHILFREGPQHYAEDTQIDADKLEGDGIAVHFGCAVTRLIGEADRLCEVEIENLQTHTTESIEANNLILSSGRFPELIFKRLEPDEAMEDENSSANRPVHWEAFEPYNLPLFADAVGMMSEADVLTDFSAAIKAIAAGRRAAATIHKIMYDIEIFLPENVLTARSVYQDVDSLEGVTPVPRQIMPMAGEKELAQSGEIEKGFDETQAGKEADRCLQCGLICYKNDGDKNRTEKPENVV
ncbi:MAG: RnfABCDGE type electron transport complex subunit B [Desulfobacterales bacterium]